ncbi:MAG: hypothetical protein NTV06_07640, partial [candidate division Zixibacteria bacterium]|nr:hypothetical protein [candidate division Zixibacteria bacterium]
HLGETGGQAVAPHHAARRVDDAVRRLPVSEIPGLGRQRAPDAVACLAVGPVDVIADAGGVVGLRDGGVGGLISSTLLTLVIVPVVYTLIDDLIARILGHETVQERKESIEDAGTVGHTE